MKKWLHEHWRKIAGYSCAAAVAVLPFTPWVALSAPLALICGSLLTTDYHEGQRVVGGEPSHPCGEGRAGAEEEAPPAPIAVTTL